MAARNAPEYVRITTVARMVLDTRRRSAQARLGRDFTLADVASASIRGIDDATLDVALIAALSEEGGKS